MQVLYLRKTSSIINRMWNDCQILANDRYDQLDRCFLRMKISIHGVQNGHPTYTSRTRRYVVLFFNISSFFFSQHGSNLSGVSAHCWWSECSKQAIRDAVDAGAHNHIPQRSPNGRNVTEPATSSDLTKRIRTSLANYRDEARSGGSNRSDEYNSVSRLSNYRLIFTYVPKLDKCFTIFSYPT